MDKSQGRTARPDTAPGSDIVTTSGHRGLQLEEALIFEQGEAGRCGVDLPPVAAVKERINGMRREGAIGLPGLSEPQVIRHFTRPSQKNYAIDSGFYPLGSWTMKHNPRLNEKMARLPGFSDIHPLQPTQTVQGALALMDRLAHWLKVLTGMPAVALTPGAGAHGEICGMFTFARAFLVISVPFSNSQSLCGDISRRRGTPLKKRRVMV